MSLGLNALLAAECRELNAREIRLPWVGPRGQRTYVEIRPHGDPAYQEALAASGVAPAGSRDVVRRIQRREEGGGVSAGEVLQALVTGKKGKKGDAQAVAMKALEKARAAGEADQQKLEDLIAMQWPIESVPHIGYSLEEARKVRGLVARHLIVAVRQEGEPGEPDTVTTNQAEGAKDILTYLTTDTPLPHAITDADGAEIIVEMGGVAEGTAVAAKILAEAVQERLFLEMQAPLESSSGSGPDESPTSTPGPILRLQTSPDSKQDDGDAETPAARAVA